MNLSKKSKTLIVIGVALILLSIPAGLFGSQVFLDPRCADSYLPSVCSGAAKPFIWAIIAGVVALVGSIIIALSFLGLKKK